MAANDRQEGGDHYKKMKIEPWDAIIAWGLGYLDGNAVKYIARWKHKGGVEDLKKAKHYIEKLIEQESPVVVGDIHPTHFTAFEGGEWFDWPNGLSLPDNFETLRFKYFMRVQGRLPNTFYDIHSMKFSNDRIWDCVNGWRR